VTHPFSPHKGKEYRVVERFNVLGEDRILCVGNDGSSRMFMTSWTNYPNRELENPYLGAIDFWYDDLQMLSKLISDIERM